jgi:hypothetical protein
LDTQAPQTVTLTTISGNDMSDSNSLMCFIDEDISDEEYDLHNYPQKDCNDKNVATGDFRSAYCESPLTGAVFKITPFGMLIPSGNGKRYTCGRIAGYLVDINVPACAVGHNRQLVNGVPAAARISLKLLKYWLALNDCSRQALERIKLKNAKLESVTITILYKFASKKLAREALREFRSHSEAILNIKKKRDGEFKEVAFSYPPEPLGPPEDYTYTSYVRMREFMLSAYVKEFDQPNAFLLPLEDAELESEIQELSERTLRVEIKVNGKWLRDKGLDCVTKWENNDAAYQTVFEFVRTTLRLDEDLRAHRLKKTTVKTLKLSEKVKKYLTYHLNGNLVRDHPDFKDWDYDPNLRKVFSSAKKAIEKATQLNIGVEYLTQIKNVSATLPKLLNYPGEFVPAPRHADFVFSRNSAPVQMKKLEKAIDDVLIFGTTSVRPRTNRKPSLAESKTDTPAFSRSIGRVPVIYSGYE